MRNAALFVIGWALLACSSKKEELKTGVWRGIIEIQNKELPFNFAVTHDSTPQKWFVYIKNADENLLLDEVSFQDDSIIISLHIFDADLRVRNYGDSLVGYFVRNYEKNYQLPFKAYYNQDFRFIKKPSTLNVTGKWEVYFTSSTDTTAAVGLFDQIGDVVTGTFLTPTGDYRYLEGNVAGDTLQLSAFDGNHIYLFKATLNNDTLTGYHYAGKSGQYKWIGTRNENASLPNADSLTSLKNKNENISFSFPDMNGNMISLLDSKYQNKVIILQLFGTWCPNCLDETRFLSQWYRDNAGRGIEIIGLAYEASADYSYAKSRVEKMINKLHVPYDFVIAGTKDKDEASKTLPMLNKLSAFPTTIFIDRNGKVRKIHTGFSGPGTGRYFEDTIKEFNQTVDELLETEKSL